jgi:hypothetical protein
MEPNEIQSSRDFANPKLGTEGERHSSFDENISNRSNFGKKLIKPPR